MEKGQIVEQGTYHVRMPYTDGHYTDRLSKDLLESGPIFSRLIAEYGGTEENKEQKEGEAAEDDSKDAEASTKPLMQEEDRNTGQIQWHIYGLYITAAGGFALCGLVLFLLLAEQGAQSMFIYLPRSAY